MRFLFGKRTVALLLLFSAAICTGSLQAQTPSGTLRGRVTDPSGAVIVNATVSVTPATGKRIATTTNRDGDFELRDLPVDQYSVQAAAEGFTVFVQPDVQIVAGQVRKLDISLEIAVEKQTVEVEDQVNRVEVGSANNASAVVIKGKDLEALSDDPDELQADLLALAGPAAGPNRGQIFIDGFSDGILPPKSEIREVRVNQNPFSAQYDRPGFGRVEVLTKAGTGHFHGQFMMEANASYFNSRNPFLQAGAQIPAYHSEQYSGNFGGPINRKATFSFTGYRRNINETSTVNATILDANFAPSLFTASLLSPRTRTELTPRIDYQVSPSNTLSVRYEHEAARNTNSGVGQFSLLSQAFDSSSSEENLRIFDTQVVSTSTVNETRLQYWRTHSRQTAQHLDPTIAVLDTFTGGGNSIGRTSDHQDRIELQNLTSKIHGAHFLKFGGRLRVVRDANSASSNYNGTFIFTSLTAYQITEQGLAQGATPGQIRATCSIPQAATALVCGGASQFTLTAGNPAAIVSQVDAGLYAEDEWRVRPKLTLTYGMRFETQSNIQDHANFAPRVGLAWGLGRGDSPKTVLRAGFGLFYDRFSQNYVLQTRRQNGIVQQRYVVTDPDFYPHVPADPTLVNDPKFVPTIYEIDRRLRAPYLMQTAITVERQLAKATTLAISYVGSRGLHQLVSENASFVNGIPLAGNQNIYQYQSAGIFNQKQFIINGRVQVGPKLSLFGYYTLSSAQSNTSGAASFPSIPGDLTRDFGRAAYDVRHRGLLGGTIGLPYGVRLSPLIMGSSGLPFNITLGQDLNGDSIFNDRPAFASNSTLPSNLRSTAWGKFDLAPSPVQNRIPINYGTGPAQFTTNLRVSKTFGLGPKLERARNAGGSSGGGSGEGRGALGGFARIGGGDSSGTSSQRYNMTMSVSARNLFNSVNPALPSGNLSSGMFGKSNALTGGGFYSSSANRRIDLQAVFSF